MIKYVIKTNEAGQRFDKLLMKILKEAPSSFVYKMLRKKNIVLNGKKSDGKEQVAEGDEISFFLSDDTFYKFKGENAFDPEKSGETGKTAQVKGLVPSEIVYEDDDVLIVNKPAGELSQKAVPTDVSVNDRIIAYLTEKGIGKDEAFKPGICNRIDRNTSGLIIAGKSMKGLQDMAEMLKNRSFKKYYLCLCAGELKQSFNKVSYIKKNEKTNRIDVFDKETPGSERIEAAYKPLIARDGCSLLAVDLITGKSHQIRGQLASLGHPLLGDVKYGYRDDPGIHASHHMLHSFMAVFPDDTLRLKGLSGKVVSCDPPAQFLNTAYKLFGKEEYENAAGKLKRLKGFGT